MQRLWKPGQQGPGGTFVECGPDGERLADPSIVTIRRGGGQLPPTRAAGRRWRRPGFAGLRGTWNALVRSLSTTALRGGRLLEGVIFLVGAVLIGYLLGRWLKDPIGSATFGDARWLGKALLPTLTCAMLIQLFRSGVDASLNVWPYVLQGKIAHLARPAVGLLAAALMLGLADFPQSDPPAPSEPRLVMNLLDRIGFAVHDTPSQFITMVTFEEARRGVDGTWTHGVDPDRSQELALGAFAVNLAACSGDGKRAHVRLKGHASTSPENGDPSAPWYRELNLEAARERARRVKTAMDAALAESDVAPEKWPVIEVEPWSGVEDDPHHPTHYDAMRESAAFYDRSGVAERFSTKKGMLNRRVDVTLTDLGTCRQPSRDVMVVDDASGEPESTAQERIASHGPEADASTRAEPAARSDSYGIRD